MNNIKELIVKVESLKSEQKFNDATKILENALVNHNQDWKWYLK